MKRKKWLIIAIGGILLVFLASITWFLNSLLNYEVKEEELGVEEDFFNFDRIVEQQKSLNQPIEVEEKISSDPIVTEKKQQEETHPDEIQPDKTQLDKTQLEKTQQKAPSPQKEAPLLTKEEQVKIIYNKYYPSFTDLQGLALERLDKLVNLAVEDYEQNKNQDEFSRKKFASKYVSAANKLQQEVDKVFYQLVNQMEKELREKKLPTDLVKDAKDTYRSLIKEKKEELLSKFL